MSLAKSYAVSLMGLAGTLIEVEAEISSNLPNFVLIGLPDASLSEAKDRVRAASHNSGLSMPARRVTINLSPASVPKHGASFDLAIALSIMAAGGLVRAESVAGWVHLGELGLDGTVRQISGVLPALIGAKTAGFRQAVVPLANLAEALLVDGIKVVGASHLRQVAKLHGAEIESEECTTEARTPSGAAPSITPFLVPDISDVIGQEEAIQALTVAAAGGHHLLMVGPPGAGKTMLAERLPTLLPDLPLREALETTAVYSIATNRVVANGGSLITRPPFEAPHHSASVSSLVGGGMGFPRPGHISLANHGVLFLDEAPEFQKPVLEALRQPLESGEVIINRSAGTARFPARFQLVLAANPCPCGRLSGKGQRCVCSQAQKLHYAARLSGPLLDRVDIRLAITPANPAQMAIGNQSEATRKTSEVARSEVASARAAAAERLRQTPWFINAQVPGPYLRNQLKTQSAITAQLDRALDRGAMSMRGYDRCLRLAWTSADLAGRTSPTLEDVSMAIYLRGSENPMEPR